MGMCMSKVGSLSRDNLALTSLPDRKETYNNFIIYLSESYTYADEIQSDFANNVIQSFFVGEYIRQIVEKELKKSKKTTLLTEKEVNEIVNSSKKEKDWLKRSQTTITNVISNLQEVRKNEPSPTNNSNYDKLIGKLKTDFITLLEHRIKQIKKQSSGKAETPDDDEIEKPSDHVKSCNDLSQFLQLVRENESRYGVEIIDKSDRYQQQMYEYSLLYECMLVLKTEMEDFSNIYSCIPKGKTCQVKT